MGSAATPAILGRARMLVEPVMRDAVASLDENLRLPSTYHLGWTDASGQPIDAGQGKGIRAALVFLGCEAVGGEAPIAVNGAAAIELIHNFSLIHDDIMDGDRLRRHRPTVWDVYGIGDAIIVGDALHALAQSVILGSPPDAASVAATQRLAQATSAMIKGQAQDVALDRANSATLDECLTMEAAKTGALLAQSVAIGAVFGGGDDAQIAALESYGTLLGLAFQAIDDNLGIWGDPAVTGKAAGNDLREHKKSMPIAMAFDRGGDIADRVRAAYAAELDDADIATLAAELDAAGIRAAVAGLAQQQLDGAIAALQSVPLDENTRAELIELAHFVASRRS